MTPLLSGDCEGSDRIRPKIWVFVLKCQKLGRILVMNKKQVGDTHERIDGATFLLLREGRANDWESFVENLARQGVSVTHGNDIT